MFTLRKDQSEALQRCDEANMVSYQVSQLRSEIPEVISLEDDVLLQKKVTTGIERAHKHGFFSLEETTQFLVLMFTRVPHFDQHKPFQAILADRELPVQERVALLLDETHERDWQKLARRRITDADWFAQ